MKTQGESSIVHNKEQPPPHTLQTLKSKLLQHPTFNLPPQSPSLSLYSSLSLLHSPTTPRQIKPKMLTKLFSWLQKLCLQTLNFSEQTFQLSIKMLRNYLILCDELPNVLQMLGCVCLHLASKLNEKSIISIDSYIECCMGIFTRAQFEQKQAQIFKAIQDRIPDCTFTYINRLMEDIMEDYNWTERQLQMLTEGLMIVLKSFELHGYDPVDVIVGLWVYVMGNPQGEMTKERMMGLMEKKD